MITFELDAVRVEKIVTPGVRVAFWHIYHRRKILILKAAHGESYVTRFMVYPEMIQGHLHVRGVIKTLRIVLCAYGSSEWVTKIRLRHAPESIDYVVAATGVSTEFGAAVNIVAYAQVSAQHKRLADAGAADHWTSGGPVGHGSNAKHKGIEGKSGRS